MCKGFRYIDFRRFQRFQLISHKGRTEFSCFKLPSAIREADRNLYELQLSVLLSGPENIKTEMTLLYQIIAYVDLEIFNPSAVVILSRHVTETGYCL